MNDKQAKTFCATVGVLFMLLVVWGCTAQREHNETELPVVTSQSGGEYRVTVIEGCQYLACYTHNGFWVVTHKGNCTNSIHLHNQ